MKGAKELADRLRSTIAQPVTFVESGWLVGLAHATVEQLIVHLDAKAAIDSAVPGEVEEIRTRAEARTWAVGQQVIDIETLLALVQRQAGEFAEYRRHAEADTATLNDARIAARAEVERLNAELQRTNDELSAAAHSARSYAEQMDIAMAERDSVRESRAALALENARLVNEHAAAMSRADVLAEGVRHWRLSTRHGCATVATQEWEREHGHMVNK